MFHPDSPLYIRPRFDKELISWLWRFQRSCNATAVQAAIRILRESSLASLDLYSELASTTSLNFGFEHRGLLSLYLTTKGYEEGIAQARLLSREGISSRELRREEVYRLEQTVSTDVIAGIHFPQDGHLTPADFVTGLAQVAANMGARFVTSTQVIGFKTEKSRICLVNTSRGIFEPAEVVVAAGSSSVSLTSELGIKLPIQAAKGYSITFEQRGDPPCLPLLLSEAKCAVTPMGEKLRIAGTFELGAMNGAINQRRVDALHRALHKYTSFTNLPISKVWTGMRPCTPDGLPVIGKSNRLKNLILATGHGMLGMSLGPVTGKVVSQLVCGVTPIVDINGFRPERFS
jgi:D-amino-acid dehydrogenase